MKLCGQKGPEGDLMNRASPVFPNLVVIICKLTSKLLGMYEAQIFVSCQ